MHDSSAAGTYTCTRLIEGFSIGRANLKMARAFLIGSPAVNRASARGASCIHMTQRVGTAKAGLWRVQSDMMAVVFNISTHTRL